jgi:hypothetical protein
MHRATVGAKSSRGAASSWRRIRRKRREDAAAKQSETIAPLSPAILAFGFVFSFRQRGLELPGNASIFRRARTIHQATRRSEAVGAALNDFLGVVEKMTAFVDYKH